CRARGAWPARYSRRSGGSGAKDAAFRPHRAVRRRAYTRPQSRPGHRLLSIFRQPAYTQRVLRRELYLFSLYRLLEASLLALMVFGPGEGLIGEPRNAALATAACLGYLPAAIALFFWSRRHDTRMADIALVGVFTDIVVAVLVTHALPQAGLGIALILIFCWCSYALCMR